MKIRSQEPSENIGFNTTEGTSMQQTQNRISENKGLDQLYGGETPNKSPSKMSPGRMTIVPILAKSNVLNTRNNNNIIIQRPLTKGEVRTPKHPYFNTMNPLTNQNSKVMRQHMRLGSEGIGSELHEKEQVNYRPDSLETTIFEEGDQPMLIDPNMGPWAAGSNQSSHRMTQVQFMNRRPKEYASIGHRNKNNSSLVKVSDGYVDGSGNKVLKFIEEYKDRGERLKRR